jgi:hypothetical protein
MKKLLKLAFLVLTLTAGMADVANAQPAVCKKVGNISGRSLGALIQWKNNQVQRACSSLNCPVSGFVLNPTIIATNGKNPFTLGRATIYNKSGKAVCSSGPRLGCASSRGECLARYKFNCSSTTARKATKGGAYVHVGKNTCVYVPNAGACANVKRRGYCDGRTL